MTPPPQPRSPDHAKPRDEACPLRLRPRVRRLAARIGATHHRRRHGPVYRRPADGRAHPLQLGGPDPRLGPGYALIEASTPNWQAALGAGQFSLGAPGLTDTQRPGRDTAALAVRARAPAPLSRLASSGRSTLRQPAQSREGPIASWPRVRSCVWRWGTFSGGSRQMTEQANAHLGGTHGPALGHLWVRSADHGGSKAGPGILTALKQLEAQRGEEAELLEETVGSRLPKGHQRLLAKLAKGWERP